MAVSSVFSQKKGLRPLGVNEQHLRLLVTINIYSRIKNLETNQSDNQNSEQK